MLVASIAVSLAVLDKYLLNDEAMTRRLLPFQCSWLMAHPPVPVV